VSEVEWSPDGRRLALVAAARTSRLIVGREKKGRVVTARRITHRLALGRRRDRDPD
jgi:hypothetical protein